MQSKLLQTGTVIQVFVLFKWAVPFYICRYIGYYNVVDGKSNAIISFFSNYYTI